MTPIDPTESCGKLLFCAQSKKSSTRVRSVRPTAVEPILAGILTAFWCMQLPPNAECSITGPYDPNSNVVLALPDTIEACRLEIEWEKLDHYPLIADMASLHFVSKDCQPFDPEEHLSEEMEAGQQFEIESASATGESSTRLVTSSMRSGAFDVANAISAVMAEDQRELNRTVPLAGINEHSLIAGLAEDGSVYLLLEGPWLSFRQRCIFHVGEWANVTDLALRRDAEQACTRIARTS